MDKNELIRKLKIAGMTQDKSLGQSFLISEKVKDRLLNEAKIKEDEPVLEIGPGLGFLTSGFLKQGAKVTGVEISKKCVVYLRKEMGKDKNLTLLLADILQIEVDKLLPLKNRVKIKNDLSREICDYRVISNIPFYLTGKIIPFFMENKTKPKELLLIVQKEVANRLIAKDGKESILSLSTKFFAYVEKIFDIPKENFYPIPKVDSALIRIKTKNEVPDVDQSMFFKIMKAAFLGKRKQLHNSLASTFHKTKQEASSWIENAGIDPAIRPEKLRVEDFVSLARFKER